MKTIKQVLATVLALFLFLTSCSKEDPQDSSSSGNEIGVYAGVLVGSTGAYKLTLKATGSTISILFDGKTTVLTTTDAFENGKRLTLTDGNYTVIFALDTNGKNPTILFTIPGHSIETTIALVTSSNSIDGNYVGSSKNIDKKFDKGKEISSEELLETYNLNISGNNFEILTKTTASTSFPNKIGSVTRTKGTIEKIGDTQLKFSWTNNDGAARSFIANSKDGVISYSTQNQDIGANNTVEASSSFEFTLNKVN